MGSVSRKGGEVGFLRRRSRRKKPMFPLLTPLQGERWAIPFLYMRRLDKVEV